VVEARVLQRVLHRGRDLRWKFALGFWLALLLNNHFPFKSLLRAIVLLPWIVATVLSHWRSGGSTIRSFPSSPISWSTCYTSARPNIDFLAVLAGALFLIAANILARHSLCGDLAAGGAADQSRRRSMKPRCWTAPPRAAVPLHHLSDDDADLAIVMTFSIIFTFTDFQLVYANHPRRPRQLDAFAGNAGVPARHRQAASLRGCGNRGLDDPVLVFATLFSYFGLARRKWQQGESND